MSTPYETWRDIERSLSDAAERIYERTRDEPKACAEGLRFITRLFDGMREAALEQNESYPSFARIMSRTRKYFADCPDADYDRAVVKGDRVYRITGNRGSCSYLSFCVYTLTPQGNRIVSDISDRDMVIGADGSFEMVLGRTGSPAFEDSPVENRLVLQEGVCTLVVRQYFLDRDFERRASFSIECLDEASERQNYQEQLNFPKLLRSFNNGFNATLSATDRWMAQPNAISISSAAPDVADLFPTPDNYYMGGWYQLADDELLEIRFVAPDCRYWSIHLMSRWLESIWEPGGRQVINKRQADISPSGEVVIYIAPALTDRANHLSSEGRNSGFFIFRWMQSPHLPVNPTCRVVSAVQAA